jgi:surface antigen
MFRPFFLAVPLILAPLAMPSAAQVQRGQDCQRNGGRHRTGGLLGGLARGALGHFGGAAGTIISPVGSLLGDAIMNLLDCDEQRKAATATEEAVRGGVGTTSNWQSTTRPGHVTGSSTVTAADTSPAEGECVTVTDIVIVDGEETRAPKRMCRRPPNNRFVRV